MDEKNHDQGILIKRLGRGRYLHSIIPVLDHTGKVVKQLVKPLMVELRLRDVIQIIVGSAILAIPVGFTEETWQLGEKLPMLNIVILSLVSILFIGLFVYVNFYRFYLREFLREYIARIVTIYTMSLLIVGILLTLIEQCPWGIDNTLAIKRIIIVTFPASMSAALTDALK